MKNLALIIATFVLVGCGVPQFSVKEADTRFSENNNQIYLSQNNRISTKSIAGGIHIDGTGVFLNPFLEKNRTTGELVFLGFNIINKTDYNSKYGGPNQLGIISDVVFLFPEGQLISLKVKNQENSTSDTISYNNVVGYASYNKWETGVVEISKKDFERLALTERFSCKITGTRQLVVYEEKDIAPVFKSNIKQFYDSYLK
ncbi:MAG: hypothetical protein IBX47_13020 [Desulfuromonadales bacterium]|nr:hypothetical protein [Desulfuromonadales bacterium]